MKKYLPFTLLFWSSLASANLIFPLFMTPYVISIIFFPVVLPLVLIIESIVYRKKIFEPPPWVAIIITVIFANLVSWCFGAVITVPIPNDILDINNLSKDSYHALAVIFGFILAFILSVIIEGAVIKFTNFLEEVEKPFLLSLYANACSYSFLIAIAFIFNYVTN